MTTDNLKQYIREIPDFPKPGVSFKDITTLLNNSDAFHSCIEMLADRYAPQKLDRIIGVESRGFIFAAPLAYRLKVGMVPVRKKGKLPAECVQQNYELEYGTDIVEMHKDALQPGERVLVLDDVIATGGTLAAACRLTEMVGAEVVEAAAILELLFLQGREKLEKWPVYSMVQY